MTPFDEIKNDPAFADLSPMKRLFLEQILTEMQKQNKDTMMPFFLAVNTKASQLGIQFTDAETSLIFSQMEKKMSPAEKKRFQMIRSLMDQKKDYK